MFDKNKVSISSNGIMYRYDKKGLSTTVLLDKWFNERVEYKRLMKKYGDEGDYRYNMNTFKRRQHVQKIILNSLIWCIGITCI